MQLESMLELARQNAELKTRVEELTRALGEREAMMQLMAGTVHDLRNAFHIALLAAETLLQSVQQPSAVELIEEVVAASEHGTTLARDLLAMVRKSDVQTSLLPCAQFLEGLSSMLRRSALEGCECAFDISPDAWPVLVQRPQLEAALINLCVNARHALGEGGRVRVAVRNCPCGRAPTPTQSAGDYVEFSVSDTGTGMPPAVLARATEAFFTTRADRGGTGLGLAMAHAFATRSGGALLIDSTVGRGTCVRLVLPRALLPLTADPELSGKLLEVRHRIRSPALKQALEMWGALCPPAGLPRPVAVEGGLTAQSDHCLVLEVDPSASPPMLRLSHIGGALARALGPRRVDDLPIDGSFEVGTLGAAYRRTLQARFPSYEYARISLGADVPAVFERLILPAAVDGHAVTHLIGIVYLSDNLKNGE
jgi:nitrogen-specific signal transduction histidine kinase